MDQSFRRMAAGGRVISMLAAGLLGLTACKPSAMREQSPGSGPVLNWANLDEPSELDPENATTPADSNIILALFEGLTALDPSDLHPVPAVATRWESSADGLTWTFHLRSNARWSTGDLVTADDFVYSFKRVLSPRLKAQNAYMLFIVKNAEAFHRGTLKNFNDVGVHAPDDQTLVVTLSHPATYFPSVVAHTVWFPVPRNTIEKFGAYDEPATPWTRPGTLVSNGPFVLKDWKPNEVVTVVKSPTYWDADATSLSQINFYPLSDPDAAEAAFAGGKVHIVSRMPAAKRAYYQAVEPESLHGTTVLATYLYRFNTSRPPLNDARVRRALSLSIDRSVITRDVLGGGQVPASTLTPPGLPGFSVPESNSFQPALARQLLAEAGFPGGKGMPSLSLIFNDTKNHRRIAEAISAMWSRELGITTTDRAVDTSHWENAFVTLDYEVARFGWNGDFADPSTFLDIMASDSPNNATGWHDPTYDRLIDEARMSTDPAKRMAAFRRCEEIIAEQAPIAPIYFYAESELVRKTVVGWHDNLLDYHPPKGITIKDTGAKNQ